MKNSTNDLYPDIPIRANDTGLPASWLDLPRRRVGLIVPKKAIAIEQMDTKGDGVRAHVVYPSDQYRPLFSDTVREWQVPMPTRNADWVNAVRLGDSESWQCVKVSASQLLAEFIGIRNAEPGEVGAFAQRHGPMWICHTHDGCFFMPDSLTFCSGLTKECSWYPAEPVKEFTDMATFVYSLIVVARELLEDRPGKPEDWANIPGAERTSSMSMRRMLVAWSVNWLLARSPGTSLMLDWFPEEGAIIPPGYPPKMAVRAGLGFFPLVCLQLAQHVCGALEIAFCAKCGRAETRKRRRANTDQPFYCSACKGRQRGLNYYHRQRAVCCKCGQTKQISQVIAREYGNICNDCLLPRKQVECEECGKDFPITERRRKRYGEICKDCLGFTGEFDVDAGSYADDPAVNP